MPTMLDLASRLAPDNKIRTIIELMSETNEVLTDMAILEGNLVTGHRTTTRTGLPAATWRLINRGVQPTKSATAQITDTCGMLEAYAEVDKALADLNNNTAAWRLSEDRAFLESMNQEMAATLFYGSQIATPEEFTGLSPRYAALPAVPAANNVVDAAAGAAAAAGLQSSMWLVVWGENTVHAIYPQGSQVGFQHNDLGEQTLLDAAAGRYQGYRTHYKWDVGLTVRDWRYAVRICNIDPGLIAAGPPAVIDLLDAMITAYNQIPNMGMGRGVFYCNNWVRTWLWRQAHMKANVNLYFDDPAGKPVLKFQGIPIRRCDALLQTEAIVV